MLLATVLVVEFVIEARRYDDPEVGPLIDAVQEEYVRLYGGRDTDQIDPALFEAPRGLFLLGLLDGVAVATGGYRLIEPGVAEIKRMYVADGARGRGLARRVLAELERSATAAGATRMVLNTGYLQREAVALYESSGYVAIDAFGHYAAYKTALFFGKSLHESAGESLCEDESESAQSA